MRNIFIMTTALMLSAAPAHAQLLGGGLGGSFGGALGGTLGGAGSIGSSIDSVRSATSGTLRGAGSSRGSQSVDRKSGAVHADRSADGSLGGDVTQVASAPTRMIGGAASGNASGSGSGSLDAQLLGTDAVRGAGESAGGTARGAAQSGRGAASGAGGLTGSLTGMLSGSGSASGTGSASQGAGSVMGSGEASGSGQGGFQMTRGMRVLAPDGEQIGKVRQLFTNASGEVQQVLVKVDGQTALLPAANFSASGNAVTSAMTEGQIKQAAEQEQTAKQPAQNAAEPK